MAGLGYLMAKTLPPLFKSRTEEIQKGIAEAQAIKQDAEKRAAEVDARTAALGADIERFRAEAKAEMEQEGERIRQETAAQIERLEQQAEQEIEPAGKTARRELKSYAANLALDLAEQRIRDAAGCRRPKGAGRRFRSGLRAGVEELNALGRGNAVRESARRCGDGGRACVETAQADPAEITAQLRAVDEMIGSSTI